MRIHAAGVARRKLAHMVRTVEDVEAAEWGKTQRSWASALLECVGSWAYSVDLVAAAGAGVACAAYAPSAAKFEGLLACG